MFLGWWLTEEESTRVQRDWDNYVAVELNAPIIHTMKDKRQPARSTRVFVPRAYPRAMAMNLRKRLSGIR